MIQNAGVSIPINIISPCLSTLSTDPDTLTIPSPEEAAVKLTKAEAQVTSELIEAVFDQLQPVAPEFMLGEWKGGMFDTGHSVNTVLKDTRWAGKSFHSIDDVDPIVSYDETGKRVWVETYGKARV